LEKRNGNVGKKPRYKKREDDEYNGCKECSDVDEKKRKIKMKGYFQIRECHMNRETHRFQCLFIFKYYKKSCIGKKDIYKKSKTEINSHENCDIHKIFPSKYSQKKDIECYNRKKFEDGK